MKVTPFQRRILLQGMGNKVGGETLIDLLEQGGSVEVKDEGTQVVPAADVINFTGNGVTVTKTDEGQVQVNITDSGGGGATGTISSQFGVANSVPQSTPTTVTQIVAGPNQFLQRVELSGDNLSYVEVQVDGTPIDAKRIPVPGPYNLTFDFNGYPAAGLPVASGAIVSVVATNVSPSMATYNARIQLVTSS